MKKIIAILGFVALAITPAAFTGCESMSDGTKEVVVDVSKAVAKVAVRVGLTAFLDGVNETDPYRDQIDAMVDAAIDAIDNAVGADSAATAATTVIADAAVPDSLKVEAIDAVQASLVERSEVEAGTTAAPAADSPENYGGPLYEHLAKLKAKLSAN